MSSSRIVLAEYFLTDELILLFIVRNDFQEPEVIEIEVSVAEVRKFVRANFSKAEQGSRVRDLRLGEWQACFGPFVEPLLSWTEKGDIIWLVPHDVLHYLPLHAVKVKRLYLAERNPICYTPSASVMKYCQAKRKTHRKQALVLGDSRNDLPYAQQEALTVAELFHTTPYIGDQATKSLIKQKLKQKRDEIDILHLACHGEFDPIQALKSCIKLAPEHKTKSNDPRWNITAEEILNLEVRVDLVTLSACETGVNERRPGDELIGLTRAFIYAGASSVLVNLWSVNDLSSQIFMERFYTILKQGKTKVEALQQAQIALMKMPFAQVRSYVESQCQAIEDTQPNNADKLLQNLSLGLLALEDDRPADTDKDNWLPFKHPYYWAPFVLVGDWK